MKEGKIINGSVESQLNLVSQAAAGVRTTGKESSRTDIMVTDPGTKKGLYTRTRVSPPKRPKQKKKK